MVSGAVVFLLPQGSSACLSATYTTSMLVVKITAKLGMIQYVVLCAQDRESILSVLGRLLSLMSF